MNVKETNERDNDLWNSPSMTDLVIDLQEGFSNDFVIITVNGQEVYRNEHVSTDYTLGRADAVNTVAEDETVWLEVSLPARKIQDKTLVNIAATPFVAVSVSGDKVSFKMSEERFIYF